MVGVLRLRVSGCGSLGGSNVYWVLRVGSLNLGLAAAGNVNRCCVRAFLMRNAREFPSTVVVHLLLLLHSTRLYQEGNPDSE